MARRVPKLAARLAAALLLVAAVACGGGGGDGEGGGSDTLLAAAADAAKDAESAHVDMTVDISLGGQDVTLEAEGEFDFTEKIGTMTMNASSAAGMPGVGTMEVILEGDYMYVKGAAFDSVLGGKEWGRINLATMSGAGAGQFNQDPTQYLEWLRGAGGDVEEVGAEEIDGVSTTHYKGDLPIDGIVEQAPDEEAAHSIRAGLAMFGDVDSFPVEVWVDDEGLPRRMTLLMQAEEEDGFSTDIEIDLSDYGVDVAVEAPDSYKDIDSPAG
jgi:hypothetical protein